jgi:hypothetical protein
VVIQANVTGRVDVEPSSVAWPRSPSKSSSSAKSGSDGEETPPGKILYEMSGQSEKKKKHFYFFAIKILNRSLHE